MANCVISVLERKSHLFPRGNHLELGSLCASVVYERIRLWQKLFVISFRWPSPDRNFVCPCSHQSRYGLPYSNFQDDIILGELRMVSATQQEGWKASCLTPRRSNFRNRILAAWKLTGRDFYCARLELCVTPKLKIERASIKRDSVEASGGADRRSEMTLRPGDASLALLFRLETAIKCQRSGIQHKRNSTMCMCFWEIF